MDKILIIKLGLSETLINETGVTTSLGDVLRTTVILPYFKDANITWLTDISALPILEGHEKIDRLLTWDLTTAFQLQAESFDQVICLEKIAGIAAFAETLKCWRRNGFRYGDNEIKAFDGSHHVLDICNAYNKKRYWEIFLYEMIGGKWNKEKPTLGYKPSTEEIIDIGFNTAVGSKFPEKAWPLEHWLELERKLSKNTSLSWQEGKK
jgi:heptosyltransferase-2